MTLQRRPLFVSWPSALAGLFLTAASSLALAQADEVPMLPTPTATPVEVPSVLNRATNPGVSPGTSVRPTANTTEATTSTSTATETGARPDQKVSMKPVGGGVVSVTKVVGEVGEQFITSREVKINQAVEQALQQKPATPDGYKIPTGTERTFPADVGRVLDEWAVYFEAKSLGSSAVQKSDVTHAIGTVNERWAGTQAWKDLEVGPDELRNIIERKLTAEDFQRLKADPALSPVSDDEALSYYKKNRLRFGSLPFSNFQENIKAFLVKTQVEKRISEWHDILRRKYKTRNFISG